MNVHNVPKHSGPQRCANNQADMFFSYVHSRVYVQKACQLPMEAKLRIPRTLQLAVFSALWSLSSPRPGQAVWQTQRSILSNDSALSNLRTTMEDNDPQWLKLCIRLSGKNERQLAASLFCTAWSALIHTLPGSSSSSARWKHCIPKYLN